MVGQQTLTLSVLVRIQMGQPIHTYLPPKYDKVTNSNIFLTRTYENYNIVTCYLLPWRRGLTHLTFYQTFAGSNPVGSTNNYMLDNCYVSIMSKDMMIQKSMTDKTCEAVCS